jgi:hypothetical protein
MSGDERVENALYRYVRKSFVEIEYWFFTYYPSMRSKEHP